MTGLDKPGDRPSSSHLCGGAIDRSGCRDRQYYVRLTGYFAVAPGILDTQHQCRRVEVC